MEMVYQIHPDGFSLIITEEQLSQLEGKEKKQAEAFLQDPWQALLDLGLEKPVKSSSVTLKYLQKTASSFITDLLRVPGLEQ